MVLIDVVFRQCGEEQCPPDTAASESEDCEGTKCNCTFDMQTYMVSVYDQLQHAQSKFS